MREEGRRKANRRPQKRKKSYSHHVTIQRTTKTGGNEKEGEKPNWFAFSFYRTTKEEVNNAQGNFVIRANRSVRGLIEDEAEGNKYPTWTAGRRCGNPSNELCDYWLSSFYFFFHRPFPFLTFLFSSLSCLSHTQPVTARSFHGTRFNYRAVYTCTSSPFDEQH